MNSIRRYYILSLLGLILMVCACQTTPTTTPIQNNFATVTPTLTGQNLGLALSLTSPNLCDDLVLNHQGHLTYQQPCQSFTIQDSLVADDLDTLQSWLANLSSFQLQVDDTTGQQPTVQLRFNGGGDLPVDVAQQQVILDWANGLVSRLRPQPTPTSDVDATAGRLCMALNRPALLIENYNDPRQIIAIDPTTKQTCTLSLSQPPFGAVRSAKGQLYYPVYRETDQTITIWRLGADGTEIALDFTTITVSDPFYPYNFAVSADGQQLAWTNTDVASEGATTTYANNLWIAKADGTALIQLLNQQIDPEERYLIPVQFTSQGLIYARQPTNLAGDPSAFVGRYDRLYQISSEGVSSLVFACANDTETIVLCIGDLSADGQRIATVDVVAGAITVYDPSGNLLATYPAPGQNYIGYPQFNANDSLAYFSATFAEQAEGLPPIPQPGYISFVATPPDEPVIWASNNQIVALWEWLDTSRLAYAISQPDKFAPGTGLLTADGQNLHLSEQPPLAVWR